MNTLAIFVNRYVKTDTVTEAIIAASTIVAARACLHQEVHVSACISTSTEIYHRMYHIMYHRIYHRNVSEGISLGSTPTKKGRCAPPNH